MISQETIDRVFNAAQIEEVVGDYLQLKKRGANLLGLCPFHNEKTPSFTVSPAKGIYYCFGCGKGGNSVNFLMEHEQWSYPESLKFLANKYNIEVEETHSENNEEHKAKAQERESLFATLALAERFYNEQLTTSKDGIAIGGSYFKERGLIQQTIDTFKLGFSKDGWRNFVDFAHKSGVDLTTLLRVGLAKKTKKALEKPETEKLIPDDLYDIFRDRVIFPIHNISGKVIAFAGRELRKQENSPKYINSPETEIYHKSRVLYGLHLAKRSIKKEDEVLMTEGYLDVITLHQAGIENVVASSGTSLTEDQIRLIKRFTPNVTVLYDGDSAGLKAALRGTDLLLAGGLNVKIVSLPEGEDPDSYCKLLGGAGFKAFIEANKQDFIIFKINHLLDESSDPIAKAQATRSILESIAKIPDAISRSFFLKETASLLDTDEDMLLREANAIKRKQASKPRQNYPDEPPPIVPPSDLELTPINVDESLHSRELALVENLVEFGNSPFDEEQTVADFIFEEVRLDGIEMSHPSAKKVYHLALEQYENHGEVSFSFFVQNDETSHFAAKVLSKRHEISEQWEEQFDIVIKRAEQNVAKEILENLLYLRLAFIDKFIGENLENLKTSDDEEEMLKLQKIHIKLHQKREELVKKIGAVIIK